MNTASIRVMRHALTGMSWLVCLTASSIGIGVRPVSAQHRDAVAPRLDPVRAIAPAIPVGVSVGTSAARVREIAHAILVARAAERREIEAEIRPALEALKALRESLRLYLAEYEKRGARSVLSGLPTATQTSTRGDAAAADPTLDERGSAERRVMRRQAARDALHVLRASQDVLAAAQPNRSDAMHDGDPGVNSRAGSGGRIRPEVIDALEADAAIILDTAPMGSEEDAQHAAQLRALLDRLDVPIERRPHRDQQPTFVFHESSAPPVLVEGQ
jgi:hypothetical protein